MEIILGTAQFGLDYGVTNSAGRVLADEVDAILDYALKEGINKLDTAQAYGDSELVISGYPLFDIITKVTAQKLLSAVENNQNIITCIDESLSRLKRTSVYALMIHDVETLNFEVTKDCLNVLERLRQDGKIMKVGVSLYTPQKLIEITSNFSVDVIQVPINLFDQRFCSEQIKSIISEQQIDLYARSIFLQGSLLVSETPKSLIEWDSAFKSYRRFCQENRISQMRCCLNFIKSLDFIKGVVIGITKQSELKEIIDEFRLKIPRQDLSHLARTESSLINPALW